MPGVLAYLGAVGATGRHAHHAVQLMVAETELAVVDDRGRAHRGRRLMIPPDTGHAITVGAHRAVALFVDPGSTLGAALNRRPGWSDGGNAVLDGVRPDEREPRAAVAALADALAPEIRRLPAPVEHPSVLRARALLPAMIADGPVRVSDVAARVGISTSRLTHVFTEQVGLPLRRYVLWLRIMTAIARVAEGGDLTHAAHAAGFADSAHLSRTCRATFGLAPSALSRGVAVEIEPGV
jgi:AraC-like DNA-binding protein